jgi:hypothetical protein
MRLASMGRMRLIGRFQAGARLTIDFTGPAPGKRESKGFVEHRNGRKTESLRRYVRHRAGPVSRNFLHRGCGHGLVGARSAWLFRPGNPDADAIFAPLALDIDSAQHSGYRFPPTQYTLGIWHTDDFHALTNFRARALIWMWLVQLTCLLCLLHAIAIFFS